MRGARGRGQGLDQPVLDWTIELVYGGGEGEPLDYVVHVCKEDEGWLSLKHTQGTLENKVLLLPPSFLPQPSFLLLLLETPP